MTDKISLFGLSFMEDSVRGFPDKVYAHPVCRMWYSSQLYGLGGDGQTKLTRNEYG